MIHYPPGTPRWVDLVSPDVNASTAFYSNLFGWEEIRAARAGSSRMLSSGGKLACGIKSLPQGLHSPQWITYVSTDDAAGVVSRAKAAGGKVLLDASAEAEMGMVLLQDGAGAIFGIFQEDLFGGAQVFNQPISLTFNMLMTRETEASKRFYSEVFGWDPRDRKVGGVAFAYFFQGVRGVAGLMAMDKQWPQAVSAHWQVTFAVDDADELAARAIELGGNAQSPVTTPFGRTALLTDPYGATFSISQQTPEVRAAAQAPAGVLPSLAKETEK